jgi:hypothetical protein
MICSWSLNSHMKLHRLPWWNLYEYIRPPLDQHFHHRFGELKSLQMDWPAVFKIHGRLTCCSCKSCQQFIDHSSFAPISPPSLKRAKIRQEILNRMNRKAQMWCFSGPSEWMVSQSHWPKVSKFWDFTGTWERKARRRRRASQDSEISHTEERLMTKRLPTWRFYICSM